MNRLRTSATRCLPATIVLLAVGCAPPWRMPPAMLTWAAASPTDEPELLAVQLVRSFDALAPAQALSRLNDPNDRLALAASVSAGRRQVRTGPAVQQAVDALVAAIGCERRADVRRAQVESLINLLANREGFDHPVETSAAIEALRSVSTTSAPDAPDAAEFICQFSRTVALSLGPNVYGGPGYGESTGGSRQGRAHPTPPAYRLHAAPVVAHGHVMVGWLGPHEPVYVILDGLGSPTCRLAAYSHEGAMLWALPLAGDDRPTVPPAMKLPDIDGDGASEIVFIDAAGRVVVLDSLGRPVRRSDRFRRLTGEFCFPGGVLLPARLRTGRCDDLLLCSGAGVLAMTGRFQTLWHIELAIVGPASEPMICDLDGDGRDECVWRGVAIDDDGKVMWTRLGQGGRPVVTRLPAAVGGGEAVVAVNAAGVACADAAGPLWRRGPEIGLVPAAAAVPGRFADVLGRRFDGIGLADGDGRALSAMVDSAGRVRQGDVAAEADAPVIDGGKVLVRDWNGDGLDEVWSDDGWRHWPGGGVIERIKSDGAPVGLFDVDGDGVEEMLFFRGKTLVIMGGMGK